MSLGLMVYRFATFTTAPALGLWLGHRARKGKEPRARLNERHARALPARAQGELVWLHGASIGESKLLLSVIRRLHTLHPDLNFLMTSQTRSAASIISDNLPPNTIHQMAPLDTPAAARRFVRHWQPRLFILAESEIWPNLLRTAKKSGVRTALINARMTASSLKRWRNFSRSARKLFSGFDLIHATDAATATLLSELTGRAIPATRNLKIGALNTPRTQPDTHSPAPASHHKTLLGASTHQGEEALLIAAFKSLPAGTRLILAPRHAERGDEVSALLEAEGLPHVRRSAGGTLTGASPILLADTFGEMQTWYDLADLVYLGGAHMPGIGGHNPLEPLQAGKPVLSGPHTSNFSDLFAELVRLGLVRTASDKSALIHAIQANSRLDMAELDLLIDSGKRVFEDTIDALSTLIEPR